MTRNCETCSHELTLKGPFCTNCSRWSRTGADNVGGIPPANPDLKSAAPCKQCRRPVLQREDRHCPACRALQIDGTALESVIRGVFVQSFWDGFDVRTGDQGYILVAVAPHMVRVRLSAGDAVTVVGGFDRYGRLCPNIINGLAPFNEADVRQSSMMDYPPMFHIETLSPFLCLNCNSEFPFPVQICPRCIDLLNRASRPAPWSPAWWNDFSKKALTSEAVIADGQSSRP